MDYKYGDLQGLLKDLYLSYDSRPPLGLRDGLNADGDEWVYARGATPRKVTGDRADQRDGTTRQPPCVRAICGRPPAGRHDRTRGTPGTPAARQPWSRLAMA